MKTQKIFREYTWLVETIRKAKRITLAEINAKWRESDFSDGKEIPRSTFNRHKAAIEDMFGLLIECDPLDNYSYYIANAEVLRDDSVQSWLLGTMSVNNIVTESFSLQDRIMMETAPVEGELLKNVIEAMRNSVKVEVEHLRYGADEVHTFVMEPYCIKLFQHRWYLLGHIEFEATEEKPAKDWKGLFSFDRIQKLTLTDEHFDMDLTFDAQSYFRDDYGVLISHDMPAERIVLRAFGRQQYYIRDLPIHHSQKVAKEGDGWTDYEYFMRPTCDLVNTLMGMGDNVKVIEPQHLVEDVKAGLKEALELYDK